MVGTAPTGPMGPMASPVREGRPVPPGRRASRGRKALRGTRASRALKRRRARLHRRDLPGRPDPRAHHGRLESPPPSNKTSPAERGAFALEQPMTDPTPEPEPTAEWDATEERTATERQAHLEAAILHDAGAEFVEELVQP